MSPKILKVSIWFVISLLAIGAFIIHAAGADKGQATTAIDTLKYKQLYGPVKLIGPHDTDVKKQLVHYADDYYSYLVDNSGNVLSMVRLENAPANEKTVLTRDQAVAVAEDMIKHIYPEFHNSSWDVIVHRSDLQDTPWRIFHNQVNENGVIFGQISTFIDGDGRVGMLFANTSPEILEDNNLLKDCIVTEEEAIAIAYQAIESWASEEGSALVIGSKDHPITVSQYYDQGDYLWIVQINNIEKNTYPQKTLHQSFVVTIDSETSEVLSVFPSR